MKLQIIMSPFMALLTVGIAVPLATRTSMTRGSQVNDTVAKPYIATIIDADEAVVYPASVDRSWVDVTRRMSFAVVVQRFRVLKFL